MLLESPEKTIRLFITDKDNDLYKNLYTPYHDFKMSTAFHPHHCNVTLEVIKGTLQNWIMELGGQDGERIDKWLYNSPIKSKGQFEYISPEWFELKSVVNLKKGEFVSLKANDIHTVGSDKGIITAWFVYEGKEDKNYIPYCYSNTNLRKESFEGLYQKPTKDDIFDLLAIANLIK